jgi:hypothetical protein
MKIGVMSELTGGADICHAVKDLTSVQATAYLREGEVVLFALVSAKEEYTFTNEALVTVCGDSAMSTKRTVNRLDFQSERLAQVKFESCGVTDRDCELKFVMGSHNMSIDIAKAEQAVAQHYYRVLQALRREQETNFRSWEFARQALEVAVRSTTTTDNVGGGGGGKVLLEQAGSVQSWLLDAFSRTNPACYRAVIERALQGVPAPSAPVAIETAE